MMYKFGKMFYAVVEYTYSLMCRGFTIIYYFVYCFTVCGLCEVLY